MTTRHIVVGVDGSVVAMRALDEASAEADRRATGLEIVYAVPGFDEAGPVLASAVARVRHRYPALAVSTAAVVGDAAEALVRRGRDAALTVVGTRALPPFAGRLLGSVSLRVAARTRSPLLVVRGDHAAWHDSSGPGGDVLLGLEDDTDTDTAGYAFAEAARRAAPLRVVHAWTYRHLPPVGYAPVPTSHLQEDIVRRARTEAAVPGLVVAPLRETFPQVPVQTRTVRSGATHALLEATCGAAVIVVTAHRRPGLLGPQLGPVATALLHHSHCPVLLVPETPQASSLVSPCD